MTAGFNRWYSALARIARGAAPIPAVVAALSLSACGPTVPRLAPVAAQPNTPAMRAFTSFSGALRCLDRLLAQARRPTVLISSTDLPDQTRGVYVGGDDMLINAVNQTNRTSRAYVFLDQTLIADAGDIALLSAQKDDATWPQLYIRGSISQLDQDPLKTSVTAGAENGGDAVSGNAGWSRGTSVVSVDMHLVAWPSRRVLAGASVANSMVVTSRGFSTGRSGVIQMTGLDLALQITRVESRSQAVRNLIELGVIELLGRHSGVPYWTCLSRPDTDAWSEDRLETRESLRPKSIRIRDVQAILIDLGYLQGRASGRDDRATRTAIARFQTEAGLIATGRVDFDLWRGLLERRARAEYEAGRAASAASPPGVGAQARRQVALRPAAGATAPSSMRVQAGAGIQTGTQARARAPAVPPAPSPAPITRRILAPTSAGGGGARTTPLTLPSQARTPAGPPRETRSGGLVALTLVPAPPALAPATGMAGAERAPNCADPGTGLAMAPGCPMAVDLSRRLRR